MTLVLDAGALLAIERSDRDVIAQLKGELASNRAPRTHGGIIGQVWRGGSGRQANLARFIAAIEVIPLDAELGRRAGALLGRSRTADVVDAALVLLATEGDWLLTSDPRDIARLADAAEVHVEVVPV
jgi:hypothetical protein